MERPSIKRASVARAVPRVQQEVAYDSKNE